MLNSRILDWYFSKNFSTRNLKKFFYNKFKKTRLNNDSLKVYSYILENQSIF